MPLLSVLSASAQHWLVRFFTRHARAINVIGGILLIGVGVYDLISNWDLIMTYLNIWLA